MKVKRLYEDSGLANYEVIQALDGKYYRFNTVPARMVSEKDLTELPHYNPVGERSREASSRKYMMYGMESLNAGGRTVKEVTA